MLNNILRESHRIRLVVSKIIIYSGSLDISYICLMSNVLYISLYYIYISLYVSIILNPFEMTIPKDHLRCAGATNAARQPVCREA